MNFRINSLQSRLTPRSDRSLLWLHAEVTLNLTPWTWSLYAYRSPGRRDLSLTVGPIGITVIDG